MKVILILMIGQQSIERSSWPFSSRFSFFLPTTNRENWEPSKQGIFVKKTNEILPKGRNHSNQQCNYLVSSLGHQRENWPKEWFFHLLGQFYQTQLNYYLFSNFLLLLSDDDQWFSILLWLQKKSFKVLERNLTRNDWCTSKQSKSWEKIVKKKILSVIQTFA